MRVVERRKEIEDVGDLLDPGIHNVASEGDVADWSSEEVKTVCLRSGYSAFKGVRDAGDGGLRGVGRSATGIGRASIYAEKRTRGQSTTESAHSES